MANVKKQENGKRKTNAITKKLLGMTERPTTAGQARYGDVDVAGTRDATAQMLEHGSVKNPAVGPNKSDIGRKFMQEWRRQHEKPEAAGHRERRHREMQSGIAAERRERRRREILEEFNRRNRGG